MDSRGTNRVGNREERLFNNATYSDLLPGDGVYCSPHGWCRVLTVDPVEHRQLVVGLVLQHIPGQTVLPLFLTIPASDPLQAQLRRPIGCVDDVRFDSLHRVLLANWGELGQLLHAAQIRVAAAWERRTNGFGGRNWLTKPQADSLHQLVRDQPDMPVGMLLDQVGVTVLHVPHTQPEATRTDKLAKVAVDVAEALENLAGHGGAQPHQLNSLALNLRDALVKYRNGSVA